MKDVSCIILAAGNGGRFGEKKQFWHLRGKSCWMWVYNACKDAGILEENIHTVGVDFVGGTFRQESVSKGLEHVTQPRVIVLEAARPGVTVEQVKELANCSSKSCTYAFPSSDTIMVKPDQYIPRENCVKIQTPQAFDTRLLKDALKMAVDDTDETITVFRNNLFAPHLHDGGHNLHKITYKEDLPIIEALWKK